jgi:hypothetical protein
MPGQREDLVALFDHVWDRFWRRMDGLDDEEWRWAPTADPRISLRWRLGHIRRLLSEAFLLTSALCFTAGPPRRRASTHCWRRPGTAAAAPW